jgi:hypothetical protein
MIQDDEDALLFCDDASDAFSCLDEEHDVLWPDQGTYPDEQELGDTLAMDDALEDSEAIDLKQVAQVDFSPLDDSHLETGFDSDLDHLNLFEDHNLFPGALQDDDDQPDLPNSEVINIEDDNQDDDRYHGFIASRFLTY